MDMDQISIDNAKQSTYSKNSWRNYLDMYDRAAAYLIDLKMPTNTQLVTYEQQQLSQYEIDSLVRVAFYCAFTTIKKKTTNNNNNNSNNNNDNNFENISVNESWLEYFSSVINNRSKGSCIFRIKSYRNRLSHNKEMLGNGSGSSATGSAGGFLGKLKGMSDPFLSSSDNGASNSTEKSSEFRNGYFVDDLNVDGDEEDSTTVLRYKYEKDFVLIKEGTPFIISLSPDWGIPFHIKEQISIQTPTQPTPTPATSKGKHKQHPNKHTTSTKHAKQTHGNSQQSSNNADNGDSQWGCSIM